MIKEIRFSTIKLFHNSTKVPFFLGFSFENVLFYLILPTSVKKLKGSF